jgi:hypothetical protein
MQLSELVRLMSYFGYSEEEVKRRLAHGDSPHNAWEGLKLELQIKWNEANQELGVERLAELKPIYERLQGLTLKSAKKQSEVDAENRERINRIVEQTQERMEERKERNLRAFTESFEREMHKAAAKDPDNPRIKAMLEKLKRGEPIF